MIILNQRLSTLVTCLVLLPFTVLAEDRLVMKNGDVISGKISKIVGAKVFINPGYADEIAVSLNAAASIDAEQVFEIELTDGQPTSGQIGMDENGQQVLVGEGFTRALSLLEITKAAEPEPYFGWGAMVDFNATVNNGNTDSRNTLLFASGHARHGDHRHLADLSFRREETDSIRTKEQDLFNYAYHWMGKAPWYLGGTFTFERDPIRELKQRYTLGLIGGRDIFKDASRSLTISGGLGYSDEEIGGSTQSGAVALWTLAYKHTLWGGVNFFHNHKLTHQLYGVDNTITKTNTGFRFDLLTDLYATVSLRYDYETKPATNTSKDDSTLLMGVGYSF